MTPSSSSSRSASSARPLALVSGASSGIGLELARCCAAHGFDLVVAADRPLTEAVAALEQHGARVTAVQADLAKSAGIEQVLAAAQGRPIEALIANAAQGLGGQFLDQPFDAIRHIIDTNVTGTLELVHRVAKGMRSREAGRVLITGSIAGFVPGPFNAVYNATKAFVDSFAAALRNELGGSGVTVTCLMPGATDTQFFERADMTDTMLGRGPKADAADVARRGFEAMMRGEDQVITGLSNKLMAAAAHVTPTPLLAEMHRKLAKPGAPTQR